MSRVSEVKKAASEYSGSYRLGASGRTKLKGVIVTFIAYTNPNNVTGASYIAYSAAGKDRGITSYNLDIYNCTQIKELIELDL